MLDRLSREYYIIEIKLAKDVNNAHPSLKMKKYYLMEAYVDKMDINQSIDNLQKQVYDLQKNLRKLQGNGLPLYPSQGATVELWERKLKQLEIQNK